MLAPDGRTTARFQTVIPAGAPRGASLTADGDIWYGLQGRGTAFGRIDLATGQQTAHPGLSYSSGVNWMTVGPDAKTLWYTAVGEDCAVGALTGFRFGTGNIGRIQPDSIAPDVAEPTSVAENGIAAAALTSGESRARPSAASASRVTGAVRCRAATSTRC